MATQTIFVFLTPQQADNTQAEVKVFPDEVTLFINVDEETNVVERDDVLWRYVKTPPGISGFPTFQSAPEPEKVVYEVRLAPRRTPFGPDQPPSNDRSSANILDAEEASYAGPGIDPITPNAPRLDAAEPPPLGVGAAQEVVQGPQSEYKYAVILTTETQVYTLDPKLIVIRRHRRSPSNI